MNKLKTVWMWLIFEFIKIIYSNKLTFILIHKLLLKKIVPW
jgi:hypothetical protein